MTGLLVIVGQAALCFDQPPGGVQRTGPHLVQERAQSGESLGTGAAAARRVFTEVRRPRSFLVTVVTRLGARPAALGAGVP